MYRTDEKFRKLFNDAGLELIQTDLQTGFPQGLFPVRFYALRPTGFKARDAKTTSNQYQAISDQHHKGELNELGRLVRS